MKLKFENHSVTGIYRQYSGFLLDVPGHSLGEKAVIADVPDPLAAEIRSWLASKHPAVKISEVARPPVVTAKPAAIAKPPADSSPAPEATVAEPEQTAKRKGGKA